VDNFNAIGIAEGWIEVSSEAEFVEAWQHLIDTGLVQTLQGWFGRRAAELIDQGVCQPRQR
jgi:fatty acid-binding protein DegV